VEVLAERLHEANKAAGQQSKQSNETAKRYYDRQTKLEQFKKGIIYMFMTTRISVVRPGISHTNIKNRTKSRKIFTR